MTAKDHDSRSSGTDPVQTIQTWRPYLQAYVDGTLAEKDALRLHLAVENSPELAAELDATRQFFAALDALPHAEPSAQFDQRVLDSVPFEYYASAPHRARRILVLGSEIPAAVSQWVSRLQRGAQALIVGYLAVLVVMSTALQGPVTRFAQDVGLRLDAAADSASGTPVLAELAATVSALYDGFGVALRAMASGVGTGVATFVFGLVFGLILLGLFVGLQRRVDAGRNGQH